jgi:hypothetical protein
VGLRLLLLGGGEDHAGVVWLHVQGVTRRSTQAGLRPGEEGEGSKSAARLPRRAHAGSALSSFTATAMANAAKLVHAQTSPRANTNNGPARVPRPSRTAIDHHTVPAAVTGLASDMGTGVSQAKAQRTRG